MLNLTATPGVQGIGAANPDVWLSRIFYQQPARHQLVSASANQAPIIRPGTNTFYVPQAGADQTKSELCYTYVRVRTLSGIVGNFKCHFQTSDNVENLDKVVEMS
jgi:hypothetical protein